MLYRKVPKTGDELSILGFGCMRLAQKDGRIDEERAAGQIRYAIDCGVNYVDTAWPYHGGESEPFVGRALAGRYRERVKLATKLPAWMVKDSADMDRFLDAQLRKLATPRIDYYLVHSLNGGTWDRVAALGVAEFLDRARSDGRIVNAGFSFHGLRDDFKRIVDAYPWTFCQIQYNYLDEEHQAGTEGLKYAASKGLAVVAMEPLRGGTLAVSPQPPAIDALWREAERRRSPAEWALRWVWDHPEVTVALSGMNDEAQVEENLAIAVGAGPDSLTIAEAGLVARVARKYREIMRIGCTGCGYCQPCPSGIDIPGCFDLFNAFHTFGKKQEALFLYVVRAGGFLSGHPAYASLCAHCLECLEKCPQELQVPDLLEQVANQFEGEGLREREAIARRFFQE
ncbi:MAG: aldo/keto reductase [Bryobacteraceae bacterium]|jgi:predicted aldo/keto reductase-like oxidoreductase